MVIWEVLSIIPVRSPRSNEFRKYNSCTAAVKQSIATSSASIRCVAEQGPSVDTVDKRPMAHNVSYVCVCNTAQEHFDAITKLCCRIYPDTDEYVTEVVEGIRHDPKLSFQLPEGLPVLAVVPHYLGDDPREPRLCSRHRMVKPTADTSPSSGRATHSIPSWAYGRDAGLNLVLPGQ
jgi:hypothetical protein